MFSLFAGALRAAALVAALVSGPAALSHEGHDHGPAPAATATTSVPRVLAQSEQYELVGILKGTSLEVYLDRFGTNEPVPDARIAVTLGGDEEVQATPTRGGTYRVSSAGFAGTGPLELVFNVGAPSGDDPLVGTLTLPSRTAVAVAGAVPDASTVAARLAP